MTSFTQLKIQPYVTTDKLSTEQKCMLFQLRCGSYPYLAVNRRYFYIDTLCICREAEDTIQHRFNCSFQSSTNTNIYPTITADDIYSEQVERQCRVISFFEQAMKRRNIYNQHVLTQ